MLKTNCTGCAFQKDPEGTCKLLHKNRLHDGKYFIGGYCNDKRPKSWSENRQDLAWSLLEENSKIDVFFNCYHKDEQEILWLLDNFKELNNNFTLIVFVNKSTSISRIYKKLQSFQCHWKIDYMRLEDDEIIHEHIFDYAIGLSSNRWLIFVDKNDSVTQHEILRIANLTEIHKNMVYMDYSNKNVLAVNRNAFIEIGGNVGIDFKEKIKQFDDWWEWCIRIE